MTVTDEYFDRVRGVVARVFNVEPATLDAKSGVGSVGGWDSLGHLRLMMAIEAEFRLRFQTHEIPRPKSIADLCVLLREKK